MRYKNVTDGTLRFRAGKANEKITYTVDAGDEVDIPVEMRMGGMEQVEEKAKIKKKKDGE